jgi:tetratricopeptide (TPR) repeat protein
MGKLQQQREALNEADALRALIEFCEKQLATRAPTDTRALFETLSEAERLFASLTRSGADLRPERGRLDSVQERIESRASQFVTLLGGVNAFVTLRQAVNGDASQPAWQLDKRLAERTRRRARTLVLSLAAVAIIALAGYLLRDVLFPPDPVGQAVNSAQRALFAGEPLPAAIAQIDAGLVVTPASATLHTWRGVLLTLKSDVAADESFARSRALQSEKDFLLERAMIWVQLNNGDRAIADSNALINLNPELAEAYYLRASGHEIKDEIEMAIADLDKTAALAEAQGNSALFATARIRNGTLMQRAMNR